MHHTKIKICGLQNTEDALCAAEAGADFIGLVFCPVSPRCITTDTARDIIDALKSTSSLPIAVFRNQDIATITTILKATGLTIAQLHGADCINNHTQLDSHIQRIISISTDQQHHIHLPKALLDTLKPERDFLLVDNKEAGTGNLLELEHTALNTLPLPTFLAGGLDADNVIEKIKRHHPFAVDVSSGVESERGIKSQERIIHFINTLRNHHD